MISLTTLTRIMPMSGRAISRRHGRGRRIDIIGTSSTSWEDAATEAVRTAGQTIRDIRVAEVVEQDIHLDENGAITFRTKLQISFKYESGD
jgi:flavin-binding protein dodecin